MDVYEKLAHRLRLFGALIIGVFGVPPAMGLRRG